MGLRGGIDTVIWEKIFCLMLAPNPLMRRGGRMEPVTPWHCVNPDTRRTRVIVWLWCLNEDSLLGEFLWKFTCTYLLMLIWPVRLIFYVYQIPEAEMKQQNASSQYLVMLGGRAEGEIWPKLWAGVSIYLALYSSPKVCVKRLTT